MHLSSFIYTLDYLRIFSAHRYQVSRIVLAFLRSDSSVINKRKMKLPDLPTDIYRLLLDQVRLTSAKYLDLR